MTAGGNGVAHGTVSASFGPCRSCGAPLSRTVVDLGRQPLADHFPSPEELAAGEEPSWPLHVVVCTSCWLVQLTHFEGADGILDAHAHASSSYSDTLMAHGRAWAGELVERLGLGPDSLVVEASSNDGYLLANFAEHGIRVLGFDHHASNVEAARALGVETVHARLGQEQAAMLAARGGADLLLGNHNLANERDLDAAAAATRAALAPGGLAAFEFHHVLAMVEGAQFDVASHSHCLYLSLLALERALAANGLAVVDAERVEVHGGSLRAYAARVEDGRPVGPGVAEVGAVERAAGLDTPAAYEGLGKRVDRVRADLVAYLELARAEGRRVAGYGAPSKGNTLLNACGIGPDLLPYTVDRAPGKHGRLLPGARIPIHPPAHLLDDRPDEVLILPWSLAREITRQMAAVRDWGGRFVVAVPRLEVLP
jgi:hypothetical protein